MPIDTQRARMLLKQFDLQRLFVEELNWANPQRAPMTVHHDGHSYRLTPQAEQGGFVLFTVDKCPGDGLPDRNTRLAIHKQLLDRAQEHILVFINEPRKASVWMWVEREAGKRKSVHEHRYHVEQPGDSLLQKLQTVAFEWDELDDEGRTSIVQVVDRVRSAFVAERVTKRFYDEFQKQHGSFLKFIKGIEAIRDREWYASIMLNRLMFIYFIQKKGFLGGDTGYLRTRLADCQMQGIPYYDGFLKTLFFQGFACKPEERTAAERELLGEVPYLNGGLFLKHQIEEANEGIDIPDKAFESIFAFFDRYQWHLDDRPLRADNEINPDVLGYIFEKYINQKQMGAYYTKEDITEYITKNTVLPFLFDKLKSFRPQAVAPLPIADIEPYIHDAVKQGVDLELPPNIAAGLDDISQRGDWNRRADDDYALPTETWREHVARRKRYQQILDDFAAGKITTINDFITCNLDIIKFTDDFISETQDPLVVNAFYFNCLKTVTVLDPTCGSGAFLFAALNILEPLYERCLQRMEEFLARKQRHPQWAQPFEQELKRVDAHPSRRYFIYKSIIVSNLYGVDIMEEAVEICKLRLFLKLVAQVEDVAQIEPLPDIDFNIRAGNTLVGYASLEEIEQAKTGKFDFGGIVDRVKSVDRSITTFRRLQTESGISAQHFREAKENLQRDLRALEAELNADLAFEYGVTKEKDLPKFVGSHKPFHWYIEFYDIMAHGGFDVIIGNPPYIDRNEVLKEYSVIGYETEDAGDIYAWVLERCAWLSSSKSRVSMIVPLSLTFSRFFGSLRELLIERYSTNWFSSYDNIAPLFSGVSQRCTIWIGDHTAAERSTWVAPMVRWRSEYRPDLLKNVSYSEWGDYDRVQTELPKVPSAVLREFYERFVCCETDTGAEAAAAISFSPAARNFVSVFLAEPPCFDADTLRAVPQSQVGSVGVADDAMAHAALASCVAETYLGYWLIRGDGFHVTGWMVEDYLVALDCLPEQHYCLLVELGQLLHERCREAVVFKKNAGKYVGNYNYWSLAEIGRRADLVLLAGLGLQRTHADEVREYVQRVLSINEHAGEKGIPAAVRAKVKPLPVDTQAQAKVFAKADKLIKQHFGYTDRELKAILSYDLRERGDLDDSEVA